MRIEIRNRNQKSEMSSVPSPALSIIKMNGIETCLIFLFGCISFGFIMFLKSIFGTFSPIVAFARFQEQRALEKNYNELLAQRENYVYHIAWAKVVLSGFFLFYYCYL